MSKLTVLRKAVRSDRFRNSAVLRKAVYSAEEPKQAQPWLRN